MAHKHSVYDTDLHFIIDPITRKITTECKKVQLMQNDHNSERITFEIPRYVEGHDMSSCNVVQVHYINTNSSNKAEISSDIYEVDDIQLSPNSEEVVIGSWLISSNATIYGGTLNFVFRFACIDPDSKEIEYQWFTDVYSAISISKGIYNVEIITEGNNYDILTQWKEVICEEACKKATAISDSVKDMLQEVSDDINEFENKLEHTMFVPNFETGNLEYIVPYHKFVVNYLTGNLEWSTDEKSIETKIEELYNTSIDERFEAIDRRIDDRVLPINKIVNTTIPCNEWCGESMPYIVTITVPGVTESNYVEVLPNSSSTEEQINVLKNANITKIEQHENNITLYSYGEKPLIDIQMTVVITRDL